MAIRMRHIGMEKEITMKFPKLVLAVGFVAAASGAFAETGVKFTAIDNVTNVYGRASVPAVKISGPVITRPADAVYSGATTVPGKTAVVVNTRDASVNNVQGRS